MSSGGRMGPAELFQLCSCCSVQQEWWRMIHFHTKQSQFRTGCNTFLFVSILQCEQHDAPCLHVRQTLTRAVLGFRAVRLASFVLPNESSGHVKNHSRTSTPTLDGTEPLRSTPSDTYVPQQKHRRMPEIHISKALRKTP